MIKPFIPVISDQALADLADIYEHIAEVNPAAAERMVEAIAGKIAALAATGNSGVARDHIRPGLRAFPFKRRCIYLRVAGDQLHVLRVLHQRQDVTSEHFKDPLDGQE